jgi:alginate O-acetyltransferase complex protein AlgI
LLFTDPIFIFFFLPLSVVVTHFLATRAGKTATLLSIILFSSIFYGIWGLDYLLILVSSVLVNWTIASYLLSSNGINIFWRKAALYLGQSFNFLLLIWFKYSFYIAFLYGETAEISIENFAIPIGISFYTFQQAVFLQECFHRDPMIIGYIWKTNSFIDKVRSFIRYTAFITFFPQLVIGPIVYLSEFAPQTARKTFGVIRRRNVEIGIFFIILGLFKKVVIADNIGIIIDPVFEQAELGADIGALAAWSASVGYYTQLYFDFSGYSEIATGTALLFGLILPINFDSPLKAVSISDFYRRWHITLTRVISRFLYTPLSVFGLRKSSNPKSAQFHLLVIWIPLLINFTAIAIWHGLTTTFLLFGLLHAIWYIIEIETGQTKIWKIWKKHTSEVTRANIGRALFFLPMILCFALFRSTSVDGWVHIVKEMFDFSKMKISSQTLFEFGCIFLAWSFCILLPNAYDLTKEYMSGLKTYKNPAVSNIMLTLRWRPNLFWGLVLASALMMVIYHIGRLPPFLYLGF